MARKLRLEYPGAIYHVINRGNYRSWIFREPKTRTAFQTCLFDACERSQWLAANLNLGTPAALSHNLTLFHRRYAEPAPVSPGHNP